MKARRILDREDILAPLLLLPTGLYIVLFVGFPFVMSFVYSISNVTVGNPHIKIIGLKNFISLLQDVAFRTSLVNTFIFTVVSVSLVIVLAHILAELLLRDFRGKWFVRFIVLMPWTAPIALGAIGFLWFLDSVFSPIDWFLRMLGLLGKPGALFGPASNLYWLGRPGLAMASVILVHVWRLLPLATVILIAGMNSIPKEIIEAAQMDGAGYFRRLFHINLPLLFPVIGVTVLFATFFTFTDMTVVWILTRGGPPPNATQVLASLSFLTGIEGGDLAQGAAIAIFFFPVLAGLAIIVLKLAKKAVVT
ncbi:MAG TPA: sugar ABC transporter permease [Nitrospirota bacterium]|nr:sugar ABC transporter permease [Nitrospirota bacterium]